MVFTHQEGKLFGFSFEERQKQAGKDSKARLLAVLPRLFVTSVVSPMSNTLLHTPHKSPKTEHGIVLVDVLQTGKQCLNLLVVNNGKDGTIHRRPRVRAQMRVARNGTSSAYLREERIATNDGIVKSLQHFFVLCLVVCNKYRFHIIELLSCLRSPVRLLLAETPGNADTE